MEKLKCFHSSLIIGEKQGCDKEKKKFFFFFVCVPILDPHVNCGNTFV